MKKLATLTPVLNSMVLENTTTCRGSKPHLERAFIVPKILGSSAPALPHMVMGGMALPVRIGARLQACFQHPARPTRLKTRKADYLGSPVGIQTMNPTFTPAQAAPTASATPAQAALIELHAAASNAATLARWYTARKQYQQAARKTRQHLQALRNLEALGATKGAV